MSHAKYQDFLDTVNEAIKEEHIDTEDFTGGVFMIGDHTGQFIVTSESSADEVITMLKAAIDAISSSYAEIPTIKN